MRKFSMFGLIMVLLLSISAFGVDIGRENLGIHYSATPGTTFEVDMTTAQDVSGMEQFIIYSGDSITNETYAVSWYSDDGTTLISKEAVTVDTLSTIKARKAIFKVTVSTTFETINSYIYGR